jgi:hypothetical protein
MKAKTTSVTSLLSLAWLQKKLNSRALLKCPKLGTGHEELQLKYILHRILPNIFRVLF